jgi:metallo-beta-lactamase class B
MLPFQLMALLLAGLLAGAATMNSSRAATLHAQTPAARTLHPDPPSTCSDCAEWNAPRQPFKVFGNTYFVGPAGVSSLLIVGDQGHILLDGGVPQSAASIDASIRALGFKTTDVKTILTSHAHYDHVAGVRALQRYAGATVLGSAASVRALVRGRPTPDDPQFAGEAPGVHDFPAIADARAVADREVVRVGSLAVTVHYTPGHTPGATSYAWQACEGARCLNIVYGDSLSPISNDTFRFTGDGTRPSIVSSFRDAITRMATLPCDVLITTHPVSSDMDAKLKVRADKNLDPGAPGDPFVDPGACKAYAARSMQALDDRVLAEGNRR